MPPPPAENSLEDWLAYLEQLHPKTIALGLDRVQRMQTRLQLFPKIPVIIVGGTNGKGSTCAMLEAIALAAGYKVGCYTSPHLMRYNERVRMNGRMLDDAALCASFKAVEAVRAEVALTYFEFGTLAALHAFLHAELDLLILEVGLGGRLDAVNIIDADVAIVTTVDIDHADYLGTTREQIGFEKAGIFRSGRPAIYADKNPPQSLVSHAAQIGTPLLQQGLDFGIQTESSAWTYWGPQSRHGALPYPLMRGAPQLANAAAAIAALDCLRLRLPIAQADIRTGILSARLAGRFQVLPGKPELILDVAHNPQAAAVLADNLGAQFISGRTYAVFAMLRDKDIPAVIAQVRQRIDIWCVAGLISARAASSEALVAALSAQGVSAVQVLPDIASAYAYACREASEDDRICVFGSFHTVAEVLLARGAKA